MKGWAQNQKRQNSDWSRAQVGKINKCETLGPSCSSSDDELADGNLTCLSHEERAPNCEGSTWEKEVAVVVAPRYEEQPDRQTADSTPVLQRTKPNSKWETQWDDKKKPSYLISGSLERVGKEDALEGLAYSFSESRRVKNNRHDPLDPKRPKGQNEIESRGEKMSKRNENAEMQLKIRAEEVNQTSNAPLMQVCQMTTTRAMVETPRPVACYHGRGGLSPGVGDIGGRCEWSKSTNHSDSRTAREKLDRIDNPAELIRHRIHSNGDIARSKLSRMRGDDSAQLLVLLGSSPPSGVGPDPVTEPNDPLDKEAQQKEGKRKAGMGKEGRNECMQTNNSTLFLPVWGLQFRVSEKGKYFESRGHVSRQTVFGIPATRLGAQYAT
ncbi:uncharacterized protein BO96DRAFT_351477 [Aspergillus niger CBS 101883]|uniref:Uncharacterized protein n=3 Tax=Aspergillus niger TaxID=5061 RepID=A2R908_ASPNC|nr:uncharacterized protein BO96DRAFT_351477 [Aspergillus niger CBS 101883]XP_059604936.1 hypothetical protein An16g09030 [Aspergillus niger]PYH50893.1 hypothetical protein BO96DRAFT_351477 [Aspergillus niger CBS 101883]RDH14751.1 hypothetical protein M747DRAFT_248795 [Aspergillus niger ATCC 13496]CAK47099.1 hypothetical protein An16g09030 [Aspergillus niger]